jgi:MerR family transcriptional regulator, copper efflux regulator
MNIGQAARASGVSAKMIRYYESIGLIPEAPRTGSGYRTYDDAAVNTLRFIHRARDFGLPIERIRLLVGLWQDRGRASGDVKAIALEHVADLRDQASRLTEMADALQHLADCCHGDRSPECPILQDFESTALSADRAAGRSRDRTRADARGGTPPRNPRPAVAGQRRAR